MSSSSCDLVLPYDPEPKDGAPGRDLSAVDGATADQGSTADGALFEDARGDASVVVRADLPAADGVRADLPAADDSQIDSAEVDDLTVADSAIDVAQLADSQPAGDAVASDAVAPDTLPVCGPTEQPCEGECVDTSIDVDNCGACGNPCAQGDDCSGESCVLGLCVPVQKVDGDSCTVDASLGRCYDGSCCTGCWDGSQCRAIGAAQNKTHCGSAGVACYACTGSMACIAGDCM